MAPGTLGWVRHAGEWYFFQADEDGAMAKGITITAPNVFPELGGTIGGTTHIRATFNAEGHFMGVARCEGLVCGDCDECISHNNSVSVSEWPSRSESIRLSEAHSVRSVLSSLANSSVVSNSIASFENSMRISLDVVSRSESVSAAVAHSAAESFITFESNSIAVSAQASVNAFQTALNNWLTSVTLAASNGFSNSAHSSVMSYASSMATSASGSIWSMTSVTESIFAHQSAFVMNSLINLENSIANMAIHTDDISRSLREWEITRHSEETRISEIGSLQSSLITAHTSRVISSAESLSDLVPSRRTSARDSLSSRLDSILESSDARTNSMFATATSSVLSAWDSNIASVATKNANLVVLDSDRSLRAAAAFDAAVSTAMSVAEHHRTSISEAVSREAAN
jgi:hypothetical protein